MFRKGPDLAWVVPAPLALGSLGTWHTNPHFVLSLHILSCVLHTAYHLRLHWRQYLNLYTSTIVSWLNFHWNVLTIIKPKIYSKKLRGSWTRVIKRLRLIHGFSVAPKYRDSIKITRFSYPSLRCLGLSRMSSHTSNFNMMSLLLLWSQLSTKFPIPSRFSAYLWCEEYALQRVSFILSFTHL